MRDALPGPWSRAGAVCGVLAVAFAVVGFPGGAVRADARADTTCRDDDGWWCLYGKPDLKDGGGLIATNNPDTDLKMDENWSFFNDATRSASNRTSSFVGLYDDIEFRGMMACLPPGTWVGGLRAGVSSLRIHPGRDEACTGPRSGALPRPVRFDPETEPTPEGDEETGEREAPKSPSGKPKPTKKPVKPSASPKLDLPPMVAPSSLLPQAPPLAVPRAAAEKDDGVPPALAIAVVAFLALAGLGIGGWLFGLRRYGAGPVPRTATDPGAIFRVHHALLCMADWCEQDGRDVPRVRAVTIDATEVTLHLAASDVEAPGPWRVAPGGRTWHLFVSDIDGLTTGTDRLAPYPLLVPVRPGMWLNLAAFPGPVALTGHRKAARGAAVTLARRLRESPWREGVRVRTVGFPPEASVEAEAGTELARVVFINDGMQVPGKIPPGSAVVAVGLPDGAGTVWRVRFGGSVVPPAEVFGKSPDRTPVGVGSKGSSSSSAGTGSDDSGSDGSASDGTGGGDG
ncbi:peptidase inhibitor family I36 protein [Actinomadura pelletieri]|uniref:peptidase inhibitor family I36 protein n=1 Tax=Actinomadura pelletieri TaxID=111805 RepID=UPI0011C3AF34|nr:peptidase inhibitor family I36 protein [Actinomadura pelletieri]